MSIDQATEISNQTGIPPLEIMKRDAIQRLDMRTLDDLLEMEEYLQAEQQNREMRCVGE